MTRKAKLSKRTVDAALPEAKQYTVWDTDLKGFGLRIMPSGVKSYYVQYRPKDASSKTPAKRYNIGKHGPITPDEARKRADDALRVVRNGGDPHEQRKVARTEPTVQELWEIYRKEGCGQKSPATLVTDKSRYESHIRPLIGSDRVSTVTQAVVKKLLKDIADGKTAKAAARTGKGQKRDAPRAMGGKGTATRTVGLLGGMFTFAMEHPDLSKFVTVHPVSGVKRYKDKKWQRPLSPDEMTRLGEVIDESEENLKAIQVILTLAFTGARKTEIEGMLRREFVPHLSHIQKGTSKTGYKFIPLNAQALEVLLSVDTSDEKSEPSEYMFPARGKPDKHFVGSYGIWRRIREKAGIPDVRLHDLRHTFATTGVTSTGSLALMGRILGHRDVKTTQQYAHLADAPVRQAVEETGRLTAIALRGGGELTADQIDKARRMASVDLDHETIARALGVSPAQVVAALQVGNPNRSIG